MKKILLSLIIASVFAGGTATANMACGIQPIKPFNCQRGHWVCQCSNTGHGNKCVWVLQGC